MLEQLLQKLGLGDKEQLVYKLILEYKKITPARVALLAKLNRTTTYSVANELKKKGLIIEDLGGKTLCYIPALGNELDKLIKEQYEKAERNKKNILELQDFLKTQPESKTYSIPKIRFIEESEIEAYLYDASKRWCDSALTFDKTWWGFQDPSLAAKYEKWIDWFWEKMPTDIQLKLFTNKAEIEVKMEEKDYTDRRQVKFFESNEFTATQLIAGSYVIYIMTKQKPFYLVEIHDSVVAHNLRELFKNIWINNQKATGENQ